MNIDIIVVDTTVVGVTHHHDQQQQQQQQHMVLFVFPVVYYCGEGSTTRALQCMQDNSVDPVFLADEARRFESEGKIDAVTNMFDDKVVILQGEIDDTVVPGEKKQLQSSSLPEKNPFYWSVLIFDTDSRLVTIVV